MKYTSKLSWRLNANCDNYREINMIKAGVFTFHYNARINILIMNSFAYL